MRYRMKCWLAQLDRAVRPYGWHVFLSDAGRVWAVTPRSRYGGSGETIDAASVKEMRAELMRRIAA